MYQKQIRCALLLLVILIGQPALAAHGVRLSGPYGQPVKNHGQFNQQAYRFFQQSQKTSAIQTAAIKKYTQLGCKLESQKNWIDADKAFRYVLNVVARRDGPGSHDSLAALEHLVTISKALNKLDDAINFQERAVGLRKKENKPDRVALLNSRISLAELYIQKQAWFSARPVLQEAVATYKAQPSLLPEKRQQTYECYAKVLHRLHKDSDAEAVEAQAKIDNSQSDKSVESNDSASSKKTTKSTSG